MAARGEGEVEELGVRQSSMFKFKFDNMGLDLDLEADCS